MTARFVHAAMCALFFLLIGGAAQAQQTFKTPEEAVDALVGAIRSDNVRDMVKVLGWAGRDILISGDDVADQKQRAVFLSAYDIKHQLVKAGEGSSTLVIGANDWPLPIPIVQTKDGWQFDTARGKEEILYRRIGRNELSAIQTMLAYVDAQNEYASMNPMKARVDNYARRIVSSPGKKDGLYWPAQANEPQSPFGAAMAAATLQGYRPTGDRPIPYHGYYFRILTEQGANAPGGAMNYVVNGNLIGGFALVAWPAQYGNSGVMTFIVNHAGIVFQKDLGDRTERIASRMTEFNPDHTWRKVPADDLVAR